jgi:hypothetical protein
MIAEGNPALFCSITTSRRKSLRIFKNQEETMDAAQPLTREMIQEKFLEAVKAAGPEGLKIANDDFGGNLCDVLKLDAGNSRVEGLAIGAITALKLSRTDLVVEHQGKDIHVPATKGKSYPAKEFRVYRFNS